MLTSQILMCFAITAILLAAILAREYLRKSAKLLKIFIALFLQSTAALMLSFSEENLILSLLLATFILAAVVWMVFEASRFRKDRGEVLKGSI